MSDSSPSDPSTLSSIFSHHVDIEPDNKNQVYRVTINYRNQKEWFILQHYSGFMRLCKFLRKSPQHAHILRKHEYNKMPKRGNFFSNMMSSNKTFSSAVQGLVDMVFKEPAFLELEDVQIFFAINRHITGFSLKGIMAELSGLSIGNNNNNVKSIMKNTANNSINNNNVPAIKIDPNNNNSVKQSITYSTTESDRSSSRQDSTTSQSTPYRVSSTTSSIPKSPTHWDLAGTHNAKAKTEDFDFLKMIGKGSFGKVLLAQHKHDKEYYAVKVLHKQTIIKKNEQNHIMAERHVLTKNLAHPFLVSLHYSFQTADKLYFVLDYANGGELFFHLQKERTFSEERAKFYAAEIGSAIAYMHSQDILYRDLKPENLLLDKEGHVVITDFGLCKESIGTGDKTKTFCGTPEYLAPEVLAKKPYDKAIDWWCFGSVLFEMLYGLPPFYSRNVQEMYHSILHSQLVFKPHATYTAKVLLTGCLQKNPSKRLGAGPTDFEEIKQQEFFKNINWEALLARKIKPPYNPRIKNATDLTHIDPSFKQEPLPASVINPRMNLLTDNTPSDIFSGFSYVRPEINDFDVDEYRQELNK